MISSEALTNILISGNNHLNINNSLNSNNTVSKASKTLHEAVNLEEMASYAPRGGGGYRGQQQPFRDGLSQQQQQQGIGGARGRRQQSAARNGRQPHGKGNATRVNGPAVDTTAKSKDKGQSEEAFEDADYEEEEYYEDEGQQYGESH